MVREDTKIEALYQADREMIESLQDIKRWVIEATNKLGDDGWHRKQYSRQLDILKTISEFIDKTIEDSTYDSVQKSNIASKMHHLVHSERTRIDIGNAIYFVIAATLIPVILVLQPGPPLTLRLMIRELVDSPLRVITSGYSLEKQFPANNAMSDLKKLKRYAEKLAKARNDDERYQPLKDIMDAMIIILAKASSMAMPAGLVDITIKALGAIGGHLADIIKEDFMAIRDKSKNPTKLVALNKKKEELEKTIDNSIQTAQNLKKMVGHFLTKIAKNLGLTVDSKQQISEEFIKTLEKKIESRQKENLKPEEVNSLNQATSNIKLYRGAQTNLEKSQLDKEKLNNLNQDAEKPKKATERKSVKQMREELKITRDKTYKDKVRTEQQKHQAQFSTR